MIRAGSRFARQILFPAQVYVQHYTHSYDGKTQHLSLFQGSQHERVGPQAFYAEPFRRIKYAVEQTGLEGETALFVYMGQEEKKEQAPQGFVEECGVI